MGGSKKRSSESAKLKDAKMDRTRARSRAARAESAELTRSKAFQGSSTQKRKLSYTKGHGASMKTLKRRKSSIFDSDASEDDEEGDAEAVVDAPTRASEDRDAESSQSSAEEVPVDAEQIEGSHSDEEKLVIVVDDGSKHLVSAKQIERNESRVIDRSPKSGRRDGDFTSTFEEAREYSSGVGSGEEEDSDFEGENDPLLRSIRALRE